MPGGGRWRLSCSRANKIVGPMEGFSLSPNCGSTTVPGVLPSESCRKAHDDRSGLLSLSKFFPNGLRNLCDGQPVKAGWEFESALSQTAREGVTRRCCDYRNQEFWSLPGNFVRLPPRPHCSILYRRAL